LVQDGLGEISVIVDCVRDGIKYLAVLEGWLIKFAEIAKNLQLSSNKLILDVPTRWNSTYLMLAAVLEFKEVFAMYGYNDRQFIWVPSHEDWAKVEVVCLYLTIVFLNFLYNMLGLWGGSGGAMVIYDFLFNDLCTLNCVIKSPLTFLPSI
jgi:hypothetical protein